jgi:hypothetical protein
MGKGAVSATLVEQQFAFRDVNAGAFEEGEGDATNFGATHVPVLRPQQVETVQAEPAKPEAGTALASYAAASGAAIGFTAGWTGIPP